MRLWLAADYEPYHGRVSRDRPKTDFTFSAENEKGPKMTFHFRAENDISFSARNRNENCYVFSAKNENENETR